MSEHCTVFGIDSHARTTTICAISPATGEVATRTFRGNDYGAMRCWMLSFPRPSYGIYESGCTGFVPARLLSGDGLRVVPAATSTLPCAPEASSKKSDRRDAERLARAALAGGYSEVWVPDPATEGLRDLSRLVEDMAQARAAARLRVQSMLLRHGVVWDERTPKGAPKKRWGADFWDWLERQQLPDPGSQAALARYVDAAREAEEAYDSAVEAARAAAAASPLAPVVDALQHLRGCGFVTALAFAAEVGDFARFPSGRRVTSYFGLAPSEHSSGEGRRLGGITRGGCACVRRLLTECAWRYAGGPRGCKRGPAGVPPAVRSHAAKGSRRLAERRDALLGRGVNACKANTATAAEMARWLWAVGLMAQEAAAA